MAPSPPSFVSRHPRPRLRRTGSGASRQNVATAAGRPTTPTNHGGRPPVGATSLAVAPILVRGGRTGASVTIREMSSSQYYHDVVVRPPGVWSDVSLVTGGDGGTPSPSSSLPTASMTPPLTVPPSFSSSWISSGEEAVVTTHPTTTVFEPTLPDSAVSSPVVAFVVVALLSAVAASVWSNDVVPMKRTELATSKNRGEVREYLDELKDAATAEDGALGDEEGRDEMEGGGGMPVPAAPSSETTAAPTKSSRRFERWLFADWLNSSDGRRQKKDPALPVLKEARWNSGDNPVLAASGLILVGVLIASVTERVF